MNAKTGQKKLEKISALTDKGDLKEARRLLIEIEPIVSSIPNCEYKVLYQLHWTAVLSNYGNTDESFKCLKDAEALLSTLSIKNNSLFASFNESKAILYFNIGDFSKSFVLYRRGSSIPSK